MNWIGSLLRVCAKQWEEGEDVQQRREGRQEGGERRRLSLTSNKINPNLYTSLKAFEI